MLRLALRTVRARLSVFRAFLNRHSTSAAHLSWLRDRLESTHSGLGVPRKGDTTEDSATTRLPDSLSQHQALLPSNLNKRGTQSKRP